MKKVLSILMATVLALSAFSITAFSFDNVTPAEPDSVLSKDRQYKYFVEDGKATIVDHKAECSDEYYSIPETIDGYPVVSIYGYAYGSRSRFYNLIIPDCVKTIDESTFDGLPNLKTVKIGSGIESIGEGAFNYCSKLTKIEVSEDNAYYTDVDGVLFTKDMKTLVQYPAGKTDRNYTVPDGVEEIYGLAFRGSQNIFNITLPEGLKKIGSWAFDDCYELARINIPDSTTEFGISIFDCAYDFRIVCSSTSAAAKCAREEHVSCTYTDAVYATSLKLNCKTIKWPVGKSGYFKATVLPAEASQELEWTTTNSGVAKISSSGKLTAVAPGTAKIVCKTTDRTNLFAECLVTVANPVPVERMKLTVSSLTWGVGKSGVFNVVILPGDAFNKTLSWSSSNPKVAKIDANGKITTLSPGTTTITCKTTDGSNLKSTCKVTVKKIANSLKLNATKITWPVGKSGHFKPTVSPSAYANQKLIWTSSDTKVATVSSSGKLTAKAPGYATITCKTTDGSNLKATCLVTVGKAVTSIKLNCATLNWPVGKTGTFKMTMTPSNPYNSEVLWTSSNPSVAKIDQNGKITALKEGKTTITCKAKDGSGKYATCAVTVKGSLYSVKLNCANLYWPTGKSGTFTATVLPSGTNKKLIWTSSNPSVAKVDQNGKVTTLKEGVTTITCKFSDGKGQAASCKVTVSNTIVSLKLNASSILWEVGKTASFKPTVLPANAPNQDLQWKSSNEEVATVYNGVLKARRPGTTTITCSVVANKNIKAICRVFVTQNGEPKLYKELYQKYLVDGSYTIKGTADIDVFGKVYNAQIQVTDGKEDYVYQTVKANGVTFKVISTEDKTYVHLPSFKIANYTAKELGVWIVDLPQEYRNQYKNYYVDLGYCTMPIAIEAFYLNYISSGNKVYNGTTYYTETFASAVEKKIFYYKNGELKYIRFIQPNDDIMFKISSIENKSDPMCDVIPNGYIKLNYFK